MWFFQLLTHHKPNHNLQESAASGRTRKAVCPTGCVKIRPLFTLPFRLNIMRIAILGAGTIARLFLEHIRRGDLGSGIEVAALCGRSLSSPGAALAKEYGVP